MAISDAVVHLSMYGMVNSLNVSTVAAVLLYDLAGKLECSMAGSPLPNELNLKCGTVDQSNG